MVVVDTSTWRNAATISDSRAYHVGFSPRGTYLLTWEPFVVSSANPNGTPNLKVYLSANGELVATFLHKKQGQWEPQWSQDESVFARLVNTDVTFYEQCNFNRIVHRIAQHKVKSFSLSSFGGNCYVMCHTLGSPGQPSFGR